MDGPGGGGSATPVTCAPSRSSHSDSQPPLKPVWPVTRTRPPAKALPKSTDSRRSDMEHGRRMRLGGPPVARKIHPGRGDLAPPPAQRTEDGRGGEECVGKCGFPWSADP